MRIPSVLPSSRIGIAGSAPLSALLFDLPDLSAVAGIRNCVSFAMEFVRAPTYEATSNQREVFGRCMTQIEDITKRHSGLLSSEAVRLIGNFVACMAEILQAAQECRPEDPALEALMTRLEWIGTRLLAEVRFKPVTGKPGAN
jgi:hypothetical protein